MRWFAWYSLTERYDSDSTTWNDLPAEGLQVVVVYRETGRTIYDGADWYWLYGGRMNYLASASDSGVNRAKPQISCSSCIKRGTRIADDQIAAIQKAAMEYVP